MKRKNVNEILKGVAGMGIALGGGTAFADGELFYAVEQELSEVEYSDFEELEAASASAETSEELSESLSLVVSNTASLQSSESLSTATSLSVVNSLSQSEYLETSESMYESAVVRYGSEVAALLFSKEYQTNENAVYLDAEGNILQEIRVLDENGNPLFDEDNNPVYEYNYYYNNGKNLVKLNQGNIISDENGNITINFDGLYLNQDEIVNASFGTDYNEKSGNKVFINGKLETKISKQIKVDDKMTVKELLELEISVFVTFETISPKSSCFISIPRIPISLSSHLSSFFTSSSAISLLPIPLSPTNKTPIPYTSRSVP